LRSLKVYWVLVAVLVVFGLVTGFSIGLPFFLLGVILAALAPFRHRPAVFWPVVVGFIGLVGGYLLTAPLDCSSTATLSTSGTSTASTTCTSVLGRYAGGPQYGPSWIPAVLVGLAAGAALGGSARLLLIRLLKEDQEQQ